MHGCSQTVQHDLYLRRHSVYIVRTICICLLVDQIDKFPIHTHICIVNVYLTTNTLMDPWNIMENLHFHLFKSLSS